MEPQIIFSKDDLPLPLLPTIERNSPSFNVRLKSSKRHISLIVPGLYIFVMFFSSSMSSAAFHLEIAENENNQEQDCRNQLEQICRKSG